MLNTEHFTLIAGNPAEWDKETLRRVRGSRQESLPEVQKDQYGRGRRSAKLLHLTTGWAIVDGSGLTDHPILFKGAKVLGEAFTWGKTWAEQDPANREFFASKADMRDR